jgi:phosphohistidine phosphatase
MKHLLLLRHAKSSWGDSQLTDFDRPLAPRGERDAPRIGAELRQRLPLPDNILSSTAMRARQTTTAVVAAAALEIEPQFLPQLYAASEDTLMAIVRRLSPDSACTLLVGHNTGLENLLGRLTGNWVHLSTAALVCIALDVTRWEDVADGSGVPVWSITPKQLPDRE